MQRLFLLVLSFASIFAEDFCFGFLNSFPDRKQIPAADSEKIQEGHLAHMTAMARAGNLLAAGPFLTPGGPRGVIVYRCSSLEQATEWTAKDPAIINKRLSLDLNLWRGPNNFGEPLATNLKADPNAKYEMVRLPFILFRKTSSWAQAAQLGAKRSSSRRESLGGTDIEPTPLMHLAAQSALGGKLEEQGRERKCQRRFPCKQCRGINSDTGVDVRVIGRSLGISRVGCEVALRMMGRARD